MTRHLERRMNLSPGMSETTQHLQGNDTKVYDNIQEYHLC